MNLLDLGNNVLITGHEGFIGTHLLECLPNAGIIDRKKQQLFFPETIKCLIKNVRVIFHLAGVSTGSGYSPPNEYLVRNNVLATRGLIRAIRQYCTFPPLVILLSSIHVYKKSVCYTEATELTPLSFYGLTKLTQELLLQTAAESQNLQSIVLRTANVYGPGCRPNYNSAVATFCLRLKNHQPIELMGNGTSQVDLVYVKDVVKVLLRIFELSKPPMCVYNLSSGISTPVIEVVEHLAKVADSKPIVRLTDTPPIKFTVDNSQLLAILNGFDFTSLDVGLAETFRHDWQTPATQGSV